MIIIISVLACVHSSFSCTTSMKLLVLLITVIEKGLVIVACRRSSCMPSVQVAKHSADRSHFCYVLEPADVLHVLAQYSEWGLFQAEN